MTKWSAVAECNPGLMFLCGERVESGQEMWGERGARTVASETSRSLNESQRTPFFCFIAKPHLAGMRTTGRIVHLLRELTAKIFSLIKFPVYSSTANNSGPHSPLERPGGAKETPSKEKFSLSVHFGKHKH